MKFVVVPALVSCLALASLPSCSPRAGGAAAETAPAAPAKSYADAWAVTIAGTPMGTVEGVMTITEADGALGGTMRAQGATFQLKDVARTDGGLAASFYYPEAGSDVTIELEGDETADTLTGETMGQFLTTARRQ